MKKRTIPGILAAITLLTILISGCSATKAKTSTEEHVKEPVELLVAAAASLEYSYTEELIPMFEKQYPDVKVSGTYDSSGKLQTQIEEGLAADVFMSAATKQMNALVDQGLVKPDSIVNLLENKLVMIVPAHSTLGLTAFTEITKAGTIAIGDPSSVPAGQYAQEALTSLGEWDEVSQKASLGTNVTEVLNWVAEGSAEAGIVYKTDAVTTEKVKIAAEAPAESLMEKVIYPVGMIATSTNQDAAGKFIEFLQTEEAIAVFEKYGFLYNQE